ncbi:MAG: helix-turn-helix domain-containing protein [Acidobacteriaceae bacterium]
MIRFTRKGHSEMLGKEDKILGVTELSKFFAVTEQTIWRWCKAGKIPAFKIGSQWKIRQSDLNRIISQKLSRNSAGEKSPTPLF